MNKIISAAVCAIAAGTISASASAGNINVYLNGEALDFENPPIIQNDRTFVPMRQIFETYGMDVTWDGDTLGVYACDDDNEISMTIGSNIMYVNGEAVELDVAPFVSSDRTFVPLRAISEALNCIVDWNGATGSVIIIGGIGRPTASPTAAPTIQPTSIPTEQPTAAPTAQPTDTPTVQPTAAPTQQPEASESGMEREVFELVNQARAENGLSSLEWADDLAEIARAHSADMINRGFFSHTNPDGLSPFDRLRNSGISYRMAAENIAYGQRTAEDVMNSWMNSSGHRANILNDGLKEIGVGAVKSSNGTVYWTQVFVTR